MKFHTQKAEDPRNPNQICSPINKTTTTTTKQDIYSRFQGQFGALFLNGNSGATLHIEDEILKKSVRNGAKNSLVGAAQSV
jgi:hypothetical protein